MQEHILFKAGGREEPCRQHQYSVCYLFHFHDFLRLESEVDTDDVRTRRGVGTHVYSGSQTVEGEAVDLGIIAAVIGDDEGVLHRERQRAVVETDLLHPAHRKRVAQRQIRAAQVAGILDITVHRVVADVERRARITVRMVRRGPHAEEGLTRKVVRTRSGRIDVTVVGVEPVDA